MKTGGKLRITFITDFSVLEYQVVEILEWKVWRQKG